MDVKNIQKGMSVKITGTENTSKTFGLGGSMSNMVGRTFKVERVSPEFHDVVISDYSWDPGDLEVDDPIILNSPSEAMPQDKLTFDPEEIMKG